MKVYLMTDLEGVAGVINSVDYCLPNGKYYEAAKELLTLEVNAAIEGFFAAGADEVVVQDGHGPGAINVPLLDPRVKYQRGWNRDKNGGSFPFGQDESFDVMAWVGQHPKAGTEFGHLCHTGTMDVLDYTLNGISIGEFGEGLFLGQTFGITPIFASGCLAFTKEASHFVPGIVTVSVKEGVQSGSGEECTADEYRLRNAGAIHLQPQKARELIREGAEKALRKYIEDKESFEPAIKIQAPYSKKIVFRHTKEKPSYIVERSGYSDLAELFNA